MTRREMYSVNAKILNMEKRYGTDSQIVQRVYDTINKAYGTTGKTRFTIPERLTTFKQKTIINRAAEQVGNSAYATKEGRARMYENSVKGFMEKNETWDRAETEKLFDFFENSVNWGKIKELIGEGYSGQVVENLREIDDGVSTSQIDELFDKYIHMSNDFKENYNFNDILTKLSIGYPLDNIYKGMEAINLLEGYYQETDIDVKGSLYDSIMDMSITDKSLDEIVGAFKNERI